MEGVSAKHAISADVQRNPLTYRFARWINSRPFTTKTPSLLLREGKMIKRSIFAALLLVLLGVATCAFASTQSANELEQLPSGVDLVGDQEPIADTTPESSTEEFIGRRARFFRHRFRFPFGGGFRYGWRYPLGYWNPIGRPIYGPRCLFGRPFGGFFYC